MEAIKNLLRKCPCLYKPLAACYQHTVAPLRSGHMRYFVSYLLRIYRKERKKLKAYGLESAIPYDYRGWRIGRGKDGAVRRYYIASYKGERCFIKIGTRDATVRNEQKILSELEDAFPFSPQYLTGDAYFGEDTVMLAIAYVDGLKPFVIPGDQIGMENVCRQFNMILDVLEKNEIVHADIHKGNLMLAKGKLYLLDYGISMNKEKSNTVDYVARPGTFYITNDAGRIYDDAYSYVQMLEKLGLEESLKTGPEYRRIVGRIGQNILQIRC